jgi:hypothetical protein
MVIEGAALLLSFLIPLASFVQGQVVHGRHGIRSTHRPRHTRHRLTHPIADVDIIVEHIQDFIASEDEVIVHLHLHIGWGGASDAVVRGS